MFSVSFVGDVPYMIVFLHRKVWGLTYILFQGINVIAYYFIIVDNA
jgi:hypothetical protein